MHSLFNAFIYCDDAINKDFVNKLYQELQKQFQVFYQNNIIAGKDSKEKITEAIEKADNFIYIFAPTSSNNNQNWQLQLANKYKKRIIPVLENEERLEELLAKLQKQLIEHSEFVRQHTNLLIQALEWKRNNKKSRYLLASKEWEIAKEWLESCFKYDFPQPTELQIEFIEESSKGFFDAFISYGRSDSLSLVKDLHQKLTEKGFRIWFDKQDIPPGIPYQKQIDMGIERAHNFIFILSPHSVSSEYCNKEVEIANKYKKRIIPVLQITQIDEETWKQRYPDRDWEEAKKKKLNIIDGNPNLHPALSQANWIRYADDTNFDQLIKKLEEVFQTQDEYVKQHTYLLTKALKWERKQKRPDYLLIEEERKLSEKWLKEEFHNELPPCEPSELHCEFICESTKNANNQMAQVFICYAEHNQAFRDKIARFLMRQGITISLIKTGERVQDAINKNIDKSDNFVYILSHNSQQSVECQRQIEYAEKRHKRILALRIKQLEQRSAEKDIDFTSEEKYKDRIKDLLEALVKDESYHEQHKILLIKALKWKQQSNNKSLLLRGNNLDKAKDWWEVAKRRTEYLPTEEQNEFIIQSINQLQQELTVFISYSRADSDFARQLNEELQNRGKTTWFDQESIDPGTLFSKEIEDGIQSSDNFLFIISPHSIQSKYCKDEVELAKNLNKRIITVLYRKVNQTELQDSGLADIQWSNFSDSGDFKDRVSSLVRTLENDREYKRNHTQLLLKALEWVQNDRKNENLLLGYFLNQAEDWLKETQETKINPLPTELQKEFIKASQKSRAQKTFNKRIGVIGLGFIAVVTTGLSILAYIQKQEASRQNIIALTKTSEAFLLLQYKQIETLITAVQAGKKLKDAGLENDARLKQVVTTTLQQSVHQIQENNRFLNPSGNVNSVSFSSNGKIVASASYEDKTIKLWSIDGKLLKSFPGHSRVINSDSFGNQMIAIFNPNAQMIAIANNRDKTIKLWSVDGKLVKTFTGHSGGITSVSFSSNGKFLASGSQDKTIKLWSVDGKLVKTFTGHLDVINSISFSPNGEFIASASEDGKIKLWPVDGKFVKTFIDNNNRLTYPLEKPDPETSVSFSPDGNKIVSISYKGIIRLWSKEGEFLKFSNQGEYDCNSVIFSPDGKMIASACWGLIKFWDNELQEISNIKGHNDRIMSLSFSPNGKILASGSYDNTIKLWKPDVDAGKQPIFTIIEKNKPIKSISFTPNGELIASAGNEDKTIKLQSIDGKLPKTLEEQQYQREVNSVSVSPNGKIRAVAKGATIELSTLEGQEWTLKQTLIGLRGPVNSISFSPNNQILASAGEDKYVTIWNIEGQELKSFEDIAAVKSISFSPDGEILASANSNQQIILRNFKLDDLLKFSCHWLNDYLTNNPTSPRDISKFCSDFQ